MTQEEKAKAYDEAIEKARIWKDKSGMPKDKQGILDDIFPELAESEDERIRKEIIDYLIEHDVNGYLLHADCEKWVDWLEKQGDKDKLIQELGEYKVKYTQEALSQYLEKQGGQNQPDKVEPKFKVGDWTINGINTTIMQIIDNKDFYESIGIDGQRRTDKHNYVERNFRLWSIKDAKDGDVLVDICDDFVNPLIFILKKFEHKDFGFAKLSDYSSYCYLTMSDNQKFKEGSYHHMNDIYPASKEQRDLLFKKMKESGYEWDADAKKLNNFEQKTDSGWSEEDERMLNHIIGYLHSGDDFQTGIDWLKSLKQRIGYEIEVRNIN